MLLTIDAGNTSVSFAVFAKNNLCAKWRASSSMKRTADEWVVWLTGLMSISGLDSAKINASIISCVVPSSLSDLRDLCTQHLGHQPLVVGYDKLDLGLDVEVDNPAEVGADLLVASAAAKHFYGAPCLVLDMGTATTLSLVNHHGNFAGVAIAPGLNHSMQSLTDNAARLPQVNWVKPQDVIGTNTVTAMQGGIFWGYMGSIENLIRRASEQYLENHPEAQIKVLATGGFARHVVEHTNLIDDYDEDLVLKGLQYVYELNQASIMKKLSIAL